MSRLLIIFFLSLCSKYSFAAPDSFADLVDELSPSVVSIASTTIIENTANDLGIENKKSDFIGFVIFLMLSFLLYEV